MAKYVFTHKAVEDISGIWNHTQETGSANQADNYYQFLIDACKELAKKPAIGKKYEQVSADVYGFSAGKHIIFYRKREGKGVEIIRILNEGMDLKRRIHE